MVVAAGIVGGVPFLVTPTSTPMWALWIVAVLALGYLLVTTWRVAAEHGPTATINWVLTRPIPRR